MHLSCFYFVCIKVSSPFNEHNFNFNCFGNSCNMPYIFIDNIKVLAIKLDSTLLLYALCKWFCIKTYRRVRSSAFNTVKPFRFGLLQGCVASNQNRNWIAIWQYRLIALSFSKVVFGYRKKNWIESLFRVCRLLFSNLFLFLNVIR